MTLFTHLQMAAQSFYFCFFKYVHGEIPEINLSHVLLIKVNNHFKATLCNVPPKNNSFRIILMIQCLATG